MKAWVVNESRRPGVMEFTDVPLPQPGTGQVLVQVESAAVNFLDTLMIQGLYQVKPPLPFSPGVEVAGRIVETGGGSRFRIGERVAAIVGWGGYAEYALVEDIDAVPIPDAMSVVEGSAFSIVYPTAYTALQHSARMRSGETVLVHAGAGGVGLAAIQLAKAWGAKVIATAGGPEKTTICREHGANFAIDYLEGDWVGQVKEITSGRGADIICDPVGGEVTEKSLKCLAWCGRLLIIGFAAGSIPSIPANRLLLKSASALGVVWGERRLREPELGRSTFSALFSMYRDGAIKPVISRQYPLAEARQALLDLAERRTHGKIVLIP